MKVKEQTGRRKADAAGTAGAVVPNVFLVRFARCVERDVDGWRCVDVDAFRASLALRGAGDSTISAYVRKLVIEICRYALEWGYLVGIIPKISEIYQYDRQELKAVIDEWVAGVASGIKVDEDYLRLQQNSCTTLQGMVRRLCDVAFDKLLCVPMMVQGESGARILDIDELLPGASKRCDDVFCNPAFIEAGVKSGKTSDVLFGLIVKWVLSLIDALYDIGRTLRYDRLNAAIEDVVSFSLEGLPVLFKQGRMIPHGDLESAIFKTKYLLESVYREIAAGMAGAGGGVHCDKVRRGKGESGMVGAIQAVKRTVARSGDRFSDKDIRGVLTSDIEKRMFDIWVEYRKMWSDGVYGATDTKASIEGCWNKCKGKAIKEDSKGDVVCVVRDVCKTAEDFRRYMRNIRERAMRKLNRRKKAHE